MAIFGRSEFRFEIINLFIFVCKITFVSTFHLHHTRDRNLDSYNVPSYRDCIYASKQYHGRSEILIPYCRRNLMIDKRSASTIDCGNHSRFTFANLQQAQVTPAQLYSWYAPLDIQNDYAKYLEKDAENGEAVFCNCTRPWFGLQCEYQLKFSNTPFMTLVETQFDATISSGDTNIGCYMGIACNNNDVDCLDWRQVCNGIRDCEGGEDEKDCIEMEIHECDTEKEYRCRNGMCIDRSFVVDFALDCMDGSDENPRNDLRYEECFFKLAFQCEERVCPWLKSSCGNGQCIDSALSICYSRRPILYQQKYLTSNVIFDKTNCSTLMFCATNVPSLLRMFNLSVDLCAELFGKVPKFSDFIFAACPRLVLFPPEPIFQPAVRLVFDNRWRKSRFAPDFVCYETRYACTRYPATFSLLINNRTLHCRNTSDYFPTQTTTDYIVAFEKLQKVLSYCTSNCPNDTTRLFRCSAAHQCLSPSRLSDGYVDCLDQVDEKMLSACPPGLPDRLLCNAKLPSSTQCIPRMSAFLTRLKKFCAAQTPELDPLECEEPDDLGCRFIRGEPLSRHFFRFQEVCNGRIFTNWTENNATDENSCVERQEECHSRYGKCNRMWDCFDGNDELRCPDYLSVNAGCDDDLHYCYELKKPHKHTCLPRNRANNGIIDCLGASDERLGHCPSLYPDEMDRRFKCLNTSRCISIYDVCDGRDDCPLGDDEWPCYWRADRFCPNDTFASEDGKTCVAKNDRCANVGTNQFSEDEMFCDLIGQRKFFQTTLTDYIPYPPYVSRVPAAVTAKAITFKAVVRDSEEISRGCRRGFSLGSGHCLCPPPYYGDTCQFQSDRLTIILQIDLQPEVYDWQTAVFVFIVRIVETNHHEQMMHFHQLQASRKHIVYLLMPMDKRPISVRIDAVLLTPTGVDPQIAWIFDVPFSFLPVNRLALRLNLGQDHSSISCSIRCIHGVCKSYANVPTRHYCQCESNWTGPDCNSKPRLLCAKAAKEIQDVCVCALGYYGPECYINRSNICRRNLCMNNGQCVPFDLRVEPFYICRCTEDYYGFYCQFRAAIAFLRVPWKQSDEERDRIPLFVVHLLDMDSRIGLMAIRDRFIFNDVPFGSNISIAYPSHSLLSDFIFVQLFASMDTARGKFHLVSLSPIKRSTVNSSVLVSNYCPAVDEVLSAHLMQQPYITRIQYYHRPCLVLGTRCFHDENHLCLCDDKARSDCFSFDHNDGNCTDRGLCQNGARCFHARQKRPSLDFGCACPKCYFGSLCQFTTAQYTIALDALIDPTTQIVVILWLTFMFLGFITNSCAVVVFIKEKTREVGCGIYLLSLSIVAQMNLIIFGTKFLILLHGAHSLLSCIIVEYLLGALPSIFDWLTACVAAERMFIVIRGISFDQKQSVRTAKWIIPIIILVNIISLLHVPFYRQLISDPRTHGHTWCTMKIPYAWLQNYEIALNIVHLIGPFLVNFLTTVILIRNLAKQKSTSSLASQPGAYWLLLAKQVHNHRPFIISPLILLLLGLPRLVLAFAFACITTPWQKHVYLASYMIACLPYMSVVLIYVWPSKIYKHDLKAFFRRASTRIRAFVLSTE